MTSPVRVLGVGAAAPDLRLAGVAVDEAWGRNGARGQVAVCGADEDVLTLSWTAATRALCAAGLEGADVDSLYWGTSRPPFAEGPSHATLAASVGLSSQSGGAMLAGSAHAGMEALVAAADAVAAGSARVALVVVADAVVPGLGTSFETRAGAAAGALVVGGDGGAAALGPRVTRTRPVLDRYRGDGERGVRDLYDGRLFREQVFLPLVEEVGAAIAVTGEVRAWSLPDPDGRLGRAAAGRLGQPGPPASAEAYAAVGDTGAAAAVVGALAELATPGWVAMLGYGGGRASAVVVEVEAPVPGAADVGPALRSGRDASYAEVLRARGDLVASGETVPMAVPPGSAQFVRGAVELLGLHGARCVDCGTISTPPSIHPACVGCGGSKLEEVALARSGTVHTFAVNHTMPAPFVAPLPLIVADLDDGARVMLQGCADDAPRLAIGDRVELVLRRYALERGVPVYGFKAKRVTA